MRVERNADRTGRPLRLHGEASTCCACWSTARACPSATRPASWSSTTCPIETSTLEIRNTCAPEKNTQLSGLYTSGGGFFTQCEAEGFRRITYFLDRPDVMAVYKVTLRAEQGATRCCCPTATWSSRAAGQGSPLRVWHDPFPKPSYLFALVAADLVAREQRIRTRSGRDHLLQVYVRARRPGQDRARDELADRLGRLGRGPLRAAAGPGALHDRRGRRLQHGRDGEQGPEHLQHEVRSGQPATATDVDYAASRAWSATSTSTTGPATASPAATGSSSA
jgi:hypothetical protein